MGQEPKLARISVMPFLWPMALKVSKSVSGVSMTIVKKSAC